MTEERGKVESAGQDWEREFGVKEGSFQSSVDVFIMSLLPGVSQIRTFLKVYGAELRLLLEKNNTYHHHLIITCGIHARWL